MSDSMNNLILIAGLPASGKSTFATYASEALSLPVIAKDDIKERLFDTVGFRSYEEKALLDITAVNTMLDTAAKLLDAGQSVILDNNFEDRNRAAIEKLIDEHPCNVITVRFDCDVAVVYERYLKRDKSPDRHPGHVFLTAYPPIPGVEDEVRLLTLEVFNEKYRRRGTFDFSMGKLIRVDADDFSKLSYPEILKRLKSEMI